MDIGEIAGILTKSGYRVIEAVGDSIVVEDPTCVIRSLADFIDFAWIALGGLAAMLLFGWGISMIRGAKLDIILNLRNLFLLFAGLSVIPALLSFLLSEELLECKHLIVPVSDINSILVMKDKKFESQTAPAMTEGFINEFRMVDARAVLSEDDNETFRMVARSFGLQIRGCEREGCGNLGASREVAPFDHEGTDLYRTPGDPIPAMFGGTVAAIDPRYGGVFNGITVRNNNGTTSYYLYVSPRPGLRVGDVLAAGDVFAYSQDLRGYAEYANVPNHLHFELWTGQTRRTGEVVNVEGLF